MPPKKKGSKKGSKKKGKTSVQPVTDMTLPALPSIKNTALMYTVACSDTVGLSRLVEHYNYDSALRTTDINGSTPLHIAVKKQDIPMIRKLLMYGRIDVNAKENTIIGGYTAVHVACNIGNSEILELLIQAGGNINAKADSSIAETPLHICCKHGHKACAQVLLNHNVSTSMKDAFGHNASFWASKEHEHMIAELGLPAAKAASPDEFISLLLANNKNFKLPSLKPKKKGGKGGDKKKKKK